MKTVTLEAMDNTTILLEEMRCMAAVVSAAIMSDDRPSDVEVAVVCNAISKNAIAAHNILRGEVLA